MNHEDAVFVLAKERGCSVGDIEQMFCGSQMGSCEGDPCRNYRKLRLQDKPATLVLPTDAAARNEYPLFDGLFGYFGSALTEVARLSFIANEQHNPGEPMHWARGKSMDHQNKIIKHLLDAEVLDTDGTLHATKLAWRSLALLQLILEKRGAPVPPNAY